MKSMLKCVSVASLSVVLLLSPVLMSGTVKKAASVYGNHGSASRLLKVSSAIIYDSLNLDAAGMNRQAFNYAWRGYQQLVQKGKLKNTEIITICDFSQSSRNKRLYIINLQDMKLYVNTYVAHGKNSGGEFAQYFSNNPESHKSSLGFYVTGKPYQGKHGLSLQIQGLEKGINDKALARRIVIHGCDYVGDDYLSGKTFSGRSFGCPAVPGDEIGDIVETIKEGSCLFIYHPSKQYLSRSKILNG